MATTVTVNADDLRLLLQRAEPLLVSPATKDDPVVGAIDRLGDAEVVARTQGSGSSSDPSDSTTHRQ